MFYPEDRADRIQIITDTLIMIKATPSINKERHEFNIIFGDLSSDGLLARPLLGYYEQEESLPYLDCITGLNQEAIACCDPQGRLHVFSIEQQSVKELLALKPLQHKQLSALIKRLHIAKTAKQGTVADKEAHADEMRKNYNLLMQMPTNMQIRLMKYFSISEEDLDNHRNAKIETTETGSSALGAGSGSSSSSDSTGSMPYTESELDAELEEIYSAPKQS